MKDLTEARRIVEQQRGEIAILKAKLAEADGMIHRDAKLLRQFEAWANAGYCPALVFDDSGHWAVSFEGHASVNLGDEPEDLSATFFVKAEDWRDSVPEAIDAAISAMEQEQANVPANPKRPANK